MRWNFDLVKRDDDLRGLIEGNSFTREVYKGVYLHLIVLRLWHLEREFNFDYYPDDSTFRNIGAMTDIHIGVVFYFKKLSKTIFDFIILKKGDKKLIAPKSILTCY